MSKRIISLIIEDINACIETIEVYTRDLSFDDFVNDRKTYEATLFNFHIIGEATAQIPTDYKATHPEIHWLELKSFRNKLIHEYLELTIKLFGI